MIKLGIFEADIIGNDLHIFLDPIREFVEIIENPIEVECDIVFTSISGKENDRSVLKGNPIVVFYTGENPENNFGNHIDYDYIIGFDEDSEKSLYFPVWLLPLYNDKYLFKREVTDKTKFATMMVRNTGYCGNLAKLRISFGRFISDNYSHIDFCGAYNNMPDGYRLSENRDEARAFHMPYKFNICFENSSSENGLYITEKPFNAFTYNTVPIYYGGGKITNFFNEKAFINLNSCKTFGEALEIINFYNTHAKEYFDMLTAPIFNVDYDITSKEYWNKKLYDFWNRIFKTIKKSEN